MEHATTNNKKWRKNNPEKTRTHTIVWWEMRNGRLPKQPCKVCGNTKTHAHHEDYSKPLEIVWLCAGCHKKRHLEINGKTEPDHYIKKGRSTTKPSEYHEQAKKLRENGKSYFEISKELYVSKGTVYKWLNDVNYN